MLNLMLKINIFETETKALSSPLKINSGATTHSAARLGMFTLQYLCQHSAILFYTATACNFTPNFSQDLRLDYLKLL
jgi:hypothetical protein